jgi:hypothetical protein
MIPMKKLRSSGVPGADEGYVRRGREFMAANEHRAKELEEAGLAVRLKISPANDIAPGSNPEIVAQNKAASAGPLASPGGEIGVENALSSSDQDHPQRKPRSKKSETGLGL